jgi:hypothetical protein
MIREKKLNDTFGCGNNKAKLAGKARYCTENGLDYDIYKLGSSFRIKRMIQRRHGIELDIEGKSLVQVTREAMEIDLF